MPGEHAGIHLKLDVVDAVPACEAATLKVEDLMPCYLTVDWFEGLAMMMGMTLKATIVIRVIGKHGPIG